MKIAILGGGITGLTAAYCLAKKGHRVTLFEKSPVLGGLAVGFKQPNWKWYLERAYHHLFANDYDIINFSKEIGFDKIFFNSPETASLFSSISHPEFISGSKKKIPKQVRNDNFQIFPMDTPLDFLKFPYLGWVDKFRAGAVLAFLKLSPFFKLYERLTAEEFIEKTMGNNVWKGLWQELFRKKFGDYAEIILASFIWARIKKRTKNLGYIEGGFQTFINYIVRELKSLRVNVLTGYEITDIQKQKDKFMVTGFSGERRSRPSRERSDPGMEFDIVISTLPTAIMTKITGNIFDKKYLGRFHKLNYLHALTLVLETKESLLKKTYWLNVSTPEIPIMGIVQHTNFVDKKNYGNNHISYLGWYLKRKDKLFSLTKEELIKFVIPYLRILNSKFKILNSYDFRAPFAQPIFDKEFIKNKPDFITPQKNFYIANLDMTYPYDRGTNYAVRLGKQVAEMI